MNLLRALGGRRHTVLVGGVCVLTVAAALLWAGVGFGLEGSADDPIPTTEAVALDIAGFTTSIDVDSLGNLWVASVNTSGEGVLSRVIADSGKVAERFEVPIEPGSEYYHTVVAADGAVWFAAGTELFLKPSGAEGVERVELPGVRRFIDRSLIPDDNLAPNSQVFCPINDIESDSDGGLWVVRENENALLHLGPGGNLVDSVDLPVEFGSADEIALDSSGRVWLTVSVSGTPGKPPYGPAVSHDRIAEFEPERQAVELHDTPAHAIAGLGDSIVIASGDMLLTESSSDGFKTLVRGVEDVGLVRVDALGSAGAQVLAIGAERACLVGESGAPLASWVVPQRQGDVSLGGGFGQGTDDLPIVPDIGAIASYGDTAWILIRNYGEVVSLSW